MRNLRLDGTPVLQKGKICYHFQMSTNIKKCAAFLLLLGAAALSFGANYYSFGLGANFFADNFPEDNYSRRQVGWSGHFGYNYFHGDFPLGLFTQFSLGSSSLRQEDNSRESMRARKSNIFDMRTVLAPSFRVKLGSSVHLPLSLGPVVIFTSESSTEMLLSGSTNSAVSKDCSYRSWSGGIQGNAAFVFITSGGFFLKPGMSLDYIFLRAEKGEMRMNYRTTHNDSFRGTSYNALNFALFFGLGFMI